MSRQYFNRSFVPSDNSSRRFHQQQRQNDFSYFQYPSHRQTVETNREINTNNHYLNRRTAAETNPHYHFENSSASSFTRQRPSTVNSSNSQSHHYHEQKRSKPNDNEREQQYRSRHYQPYPNPRPTQIQPTNPTPRHVASFSQSFDYGIHNRHIHHQSSPPVLSPHLHRQSIPSSNTYHRNGMTFEPISHYSPLFHRTSMATHIQQRSSPSFLLTDLLHRVIDAHASSSYSDNHHPPTASIDLIAYAWVSPNHEIFSLPTTFSIQFGDFFDLIIPNETPVVGLTDSELDRIPTMIYKNPKSDDKCAVCLSEYINGEKLKRLKCKHYFHSECIDPWLKTSTRCPICRGEQTN